MYGQKDFEITQMFNGLLGRFYFKYKSSRSNPGLYVTSYRLFDGLLQLRRSIALLKLIVPKYDVNSKFSVVLKVYRENEKGGRCFGCSGFRYDEEVDPGSYSIHLVPVSIVIILFVLYIQTPNKQ